MFSPLSKNIWGFQVHNNLKSLNTTAINRFGQLLDLTNDII
jgi:hypothetical protein